MKIARMLILIIFVLLMFLPLYLALVAASHENTAMMQWPQPFFPGRVLWQNIKTVLIEGVVATGGVPLWSMLLNSLIMALLLAIGKVAFSLLSAFALVYCNFPGKKICFALIFMTLMLPIEVRIIPAFQVTVALGWINTFAGLTLPLMASATATLLFRQFFRTIPHELADAARLDGAGPLRFFYDILLPLSRTQIIALFIIMFVYGWNQYLWPLVITTAPDHHTIVMGIHYLANVADEIPQWNYIMATALIALLPPCLVVLLLQRWFETGLGD